ncbi:hypothetical protein AGABI2DRAFT_186738 [Agaricus bisporus var. bisporus H97]|uniref:hypothetical protein n=1 Tax=Agaricus bisporus var. bisporus (strain H97 / ATCC MYA-4626 / FGSC 10389) TaxID=936046 RepID=UPI00029F5732|nr:hypothetical protein AGABI2DRAFT_186738 [Agaricus bisporus var. bisporus H97]EKV46106.1 hypothetical protein AGABI2DRAFT_186738 [Agaricus bisporus var. bisporus H97]
MESLPAQLEPLIMKTLGTVFIGFSAACVIYGILITQVFQYFRGYPFDKARFKYAVIVLTILETADQIFTGHITFWYTVKNWGRFDVLLKAELTWSLILQILIGSIVGTIVKTYFGLRVWRFSGRNYYITGVILVLTYTQLGLAIYYSYKAFMLPSLFAASSLRVLGSVSLGTGVLTDVTTAVTLCIYLNRLRTGLHTSDSLVNMLIRYAINTGALTSAVSLTTLLLYDFLPDNNLYYASVYIILSKLYAISLMATLNTRRQVRGRGTEQEGATATNNTNMFHLGTRVPSMGPYDTDQWEKMIPPTQSRGRSILMEPAQQAYYSKDEFPFNSFHPGTSSNNNRVGHAY